MAATTPARPTPEPRAIADAPRDGTMLRLWVRYPEDGSWTPLDDAHESWTIGFNNFDNTEDDRWQVVGWCWSHDHLVEAANDVEVLGWLPFHGDAYHAEQIAEAMDEGDGFWKPCSGCQEGVDGYVSQKEYPLNPVFRCQPGGGCSECGGLGVLWDDTDYDAMATAIMAGMDAEEAVATSPTTARDGDDDLDLYDEKVQSGIAWTLRQVGEALGLTTWTQGDGSESVEGDVHAEIHTILIDAGLRDPETNAMATLAEQASPPAWRADMGNAPRDGTPVDLLVNANRYTDMSWAERGWQREEGYPVITRRLTTAPSHWMLSPVAPQPEAGA